MTATTGFSHTHELMRRGLDERLFTAAVLLISHGGKILFHEPYGTLGRSETSAVTLETLFDLASLTKVLCTTPCWIVIASEDLRILDDPLLRWFAASPSDKRSITPRQLLAHASGLPAWRPYYLNGLADPSFVGRLREVILNESLQYPPGAGCVYSDLGFMLLGLMIQTLSGQDMETFCSERIYKPLSLENELVFKPDVKRWAVAQTRPGDVPGAVNDLNARILGGVAGHAGLFGTARGVASLSQQILCGLKSEASLFERGPLNEFCRKAGFTRESTRCLGFDTPSDVGASSGRFFSPESLGHTGFTGTSVWMDPSRDLCVVLLTNRVIMGEADQRIKTFRPLVHDSIMQEMAV